MNRLASVPLSVSLALGLLAAAPAPAAAVEPGGLALRLAVPDVSSVGFDPAELESLLCASSDSRGADDCRLVVKNDGSTGRSPEMGDLELTVLPGELLSRCHPVVQLQASALSLESMEDEPLSTSCGGWSYVVTLDPEVVQPLSALTLLAQGTGDHGFFVGTFELAVEITFSGPGTVVATRRLSLDVSGRWTTAGLAPVDGSSDLVLFAEPMLGQWVERPDTAKDSTRCTQLYLVPVPSSLSRLNAPSGRLD